MSTYTARKIQRAKDAWDRSNDWRDYRRYMVAATEPVYTLFDRPNGLAVVPYLTRTPNLDEDPIDIANWRTTIANLPHGDEYVSEARVRHWITPMEYLVVPIDRETVEAVMDLHTALEGYPVLDEDEWSTVEREMIDEAIQSYILDDLGRELQREYDIEDVDSDLLGTPEVFWRWIEEHSRSTEALSMNGPDVVCPDADDRLRDLYLKARGWVHDPDRDGTGCGWCGSWAQVNDENFCRECFDAANDESEKS